MYQETKELTVQEIVHPCLIQWHKRIDIAEERGHFSELDGNAADHWDQCAIGESFRLHPELPRNGLGGPKDSVLLHLGLAFGHVVNADTSDFEEARHILSQIEDRLHYLFS